MQPAQSPDARWTAEHGRRRHTHTNTQIWHTFIIRIYYRLFACVSLTLVVGIDFTHISHVNLRLRARIAPVSTKINMMSDVARLMCLRAKSHVGFVLAALRFVRGFRVRGAVFCRKRLRVHTLTCLVSYRNAYTYTHSTGGRIRFIFIFMHCSHAVLYGGQ